MSLECPSLTSTRHAAPRSPCAIMALPAELLQGIMKHIESPSDLLSLGRCCKAMHEIWSRADTQAAWLAEQRPKSAVLHAVRLSTKTEAAVDVIRILVEVHGANVNGSVGGMGMTPLMALASGQGSIAASRYLLSVPGIDVNETRGISGVTALVVACLDGKVQQAQMLIGHPGIDVNKSHPLLMAMDKFESRDLQDGADEIVHLLLSHPGLDINARTVRGATYLIQAIPYNRYALVKDLVSHPGIDLNALFEGRSALLCACAVLLEASALALIDCQRVDVNLNSQGISALERAAFAGSESIVRRLLQRTDLAWGRCPRLWPGPLQRAMRESWPSSEGIEPFEGR